MAAQKQNAHFWGMFFKDCTKFWWLIKQQKLKRSYKAKHFVVFVSYNNSIKLILMVRWLVKGWMVWRELMQTSLTGHLFSSCRTGLLSVQFCWLASYQSKFQARAEPKRTLTEKAKKLEVQECVRRRRDLRVRLHLVLYLLLCLLPFHEQCKCSS